MALLCAVVLQKHLFVPLRSCHINRQPMPGASKATYSARTPFLPKRHLVYVYKNVLLIPDMEPLSCSSRSAETFQLSVEADVTAREALWKTAEATEVARMRTDEAVASASAAAAASSVASVVGSKTAWCHDQRSKPGIPLALIVVYAGS